jgi:hypothetical protein
LAVERFQALNQLRQARQSLPPAGRFVSIAIAEPCLDFFQAD